MVERSNKMTNDQCNDKDQNFKDADNCKSIEEACSCSKVGKFFHEVCPDTLGYSVKRESGKTDSDCVEICFLFEF